MNFTIAKAIHKAQEEIKEGNLHNASIFIDEYLAAIKDNPTAWDIKAHIYYMEIIVGTRLFKDVYDLYKYIKANILFINENTTDPTMDELIAKTSVQVYESCCVLIVNHKKHKKINKAKLAVGYTLQGVGFILGFAHERIAHMISSWLRKHGYITARNGKIKNQTIKNSTNVLYQLKADIKKIIPFCLEEEKWKSYLLNSISIVEQKYHRTQGNKKSFHG
jgi:hypothetical protein